MRQVLLRASRRDDFGALDHPLLDGVVIGCRWAEINPEPDVFVLAPIKVTIARWHAAGKTATLRFVPYSNADEGRVTPLWAYREMRKISTSEGSIPDVLDPAYHSLLPPIIQALASCGADGLVASVGHNGTLTACTDREGARSWISAGWTEERWSDLCRQVLVQNRAHALPRPPAVIAGHVLIRDGREHATALEGIVDRCHAAGATVITTGLESRRADMPETVARMQRLTRVGSRSARLGLGDDWPLYVEPKRRHLKPTLGRDAADFAAALKLAAALGATTLFCQGPEITAGDPASGAAFVPAVHAALKAFREGP